MTPLLRLFDIHKRFGHKMVLACEELTLNAGEIIHLTGRNGAGKTTLLKIIAGLEPPDRATVCEHGQRTPWHRAARRLRHQVVYLHQRPFMFDASVADNLAYGLRAAGVPRLQLYARVREALHRADLNDMAHRNARTLSGGEQQRLALARAWVLAPRVLLLDEPTANMDLEFREQTWALLRTMREGELCMVITNHEAHGPALGDCRKLHLERGRLDEAHAGYALDNVIQWPATGAARREAHS